MWAEDGGYIRKLSETYKEQPRNFLTCSLYTYIQGTGNEASYLSSFSAVSTNSLKVMNLSIYIPELQKDQYH